MDDVIAVLVEKLGLTAEEITDILWLALLQWQSTTTVSTEEQQASISASPLDSSHVPHLPTDKPDKPNSPQPSVSPTPSVTPTPTVPLYSRRTQSPAQSSPDQDSLPFPVPNATALRNSLALLRSLRPLMQRVPSKTSWILDTEATAQYIAETKLWLPQRKPVQEPWFDLALVVDASPSMLIWQRHVFELRRLLAQTGAFRDVRTWSLSANFEGQLCLHPKLGTGVNCQAPRSPEELIDPTGLRLILVVSDCISPLWQSGTVTTALKIWAEHGPMALVQMLPEWLWDRTALSEVPKVRFHSLAPGMANQKLSVVRRDRWRRTTSRDIKIPVLTLDPPITSLWSQMVAGKGNTGAPGLLFSLVERTSFVQVVDLSSEERVQRFRVFSSPMARRLAGLLAACPVVSLPIVRMIQDAMLTQSQQVHVAEVLLSGMFRLATPIEADTSPDEIEYKFYDEGIRQILLDSTPAPDTFSVLSKWIDRRIGKSLDDFIAILQDPQSNSALVERSQPFAGVAIEVLKRQGGRYARFAVDLEQRLLPHQIAEASTFPELPPLHIFKFELATLEVRRSAASRRLGKPRVARHRRQAQYFIEDLGDATKLEMVIIPGGSFSMGSLAEELGHNNDESPQHLVTVQSFAMSKYPITQSQWRAIAALPQLRHALDPDPSDFKGDDRPVDNVSWLEAVEFCERLSRKTGRDYRLPSEAEWEYACRAGTTTAFHFGEMITTDVANYDGDYTYGSVPKGVHRRETTPVGSFGVANDFGLYDMHGNVWEWCADHWHGSYEGAPIDGSVWLSADEGTLRQLRGGSWDVKPESCRSACRANNGVAYKDSVVGFRVAYQLLLTPPGRN
jgi:formylglycine-generating enzyme required for sulfatase activity